MKSRFALLCISLAMFTGCTVNPPVQGRADPFDSQQIHFATDELRRDTAVGTPQVARTESGNILVVTIPIRSAINKNLYVDYRVSFFDSTGQLLNQTGWMSKTLEANTPDRVVVNSFGPRAADFQVDFRYSR